MTRLGRRNIRRTGNVQLPSCARSEIPARERHATFLMNFLIAMIIPFLWIQGIQGAAQAASLKIGDSAPAITLADLNGHAVSIPEDLTGKAVVIHFWVDSCIFCLEEMPALERLYKEFQGKGLIIVAINVGQTPERVRAFVSKVKVSYPVLLDPDRKMAKTYGVLGFPRTFMLNRKGVIKYKILGDATEEMLKKLVLNIL